MVIFEAFLPNITDSVAIWKNQVVSTSATYAPRQPAPTPSSLCTPSIASRFLDLRAGAAQSNITLQRGGGHDAAHPNEIMRDTLSFKHD